MKRTPLRRKRSRPRAYKTPRCSYGAGRCKRPAAIDGMCASHRKQHFDHEWSLAVRERGSCEAAGWAVDGESPVTCGGGLQAAHGFPRTYMGTRWVVLNGFCLCAGHHRWFTTKPLHWTEFMLERLGSEPYEELRRLALSHK